MAAALLAALPAVAQAGEVTPSIVGGAPASEPYTFVVSIQVARGDDPNHHTCTGTLVASRWVETAAHCVTTYPSVAPNDPSLYHVRVGSLDRTTGGVVANVASIKVHPTWDWATGDDPVGDIALLELDRDVNRIPALIGPGPGGPGATVRMLGWGRTIAGDPNSLPKGLRQLDSALLPNASCGITTGELCVDDHEHTAAACNGDSGGPALRKVYGIWTLVGNDSRGLGESCADAPEVYTDITHYRTWVYSTIFGLNAPAAATTG
ncbi:S1 family peptidase [Embleya scabrispora]|uniref:S1 family peptidase n=1 Tax=Embleya scabrispora TaxID=159449 RepID=UPI00036F2BCB|nr:serine protease [Embleya scabrispora]MYS86717.1 trypsin-like serine protease [Streptomyces sp. SID5474]